MSLFDDIKTGLSEAIEYEKGNLKAKKTIIISKFFGKTLKKPLTNPKKRL